MQFWQGSIIYLVIINLITFAMYGTDKNKARNHKWRIPERTLIFMAFIGGGLGAIIGMNIFHHKTQKPKFKILVPIGLVLTIVITILATYGNNHLEVTTYNYDAGLNCKIVHLSDVHNTTIYWNKDALPNAVKDLDPDYIVITGDLIDSIHTDMDSAIYTAKALAEITDTYYVTGNHELRLSEDDLNTFHARLREAGVIILSNEYVTLTDNSGTEFALIGLDDANLGDDTLKGIMSTIDKDLPTILLAHEPQYFDNYADSNVNYVLSGHYHAGQFVIAGRGFITPEFEIFPEYSFGEKTTNNTTLITSRGIGNSIIPWRINNQPEIVVIEMN
ncbi:MAG: DUF1294 domain-containing protein [Saccharofermentans sp.]|nr:DUF1294 domain-containing protein [Saccharofermentans sp.]